MPFGSQATSFPSDHANRTTRRRERRDALPRAAARGAPFGRPLHEVVATLSTRLADTPGERLGEAIDATLRTLAESLPADRVTLHLRSSDTSHWVEVATASGVGGEGLVAGDFEARCARGDAFEGFELSEHPFLAMQLAKGENVCWRSEAALPAEADAERALFRSRETASLLFVPMIQHGALTGFLEVAATGSPRHWGDEVPSLSRVVVDLLSSALARSRGEARLAEAEGRLQTTQRLEIIGRLASSIAHDFNNYLTAITGYGELLGYEIEAGEPGSEELGEIRNAADRATVLVDQILGFHREKGITPRALELGSIVAALAKIIDRVAGDDIEVVYRLADDLAPVDVDPSRFDQVILNLIANARDAMAKQGGVLTIETRAATLGDSGGQGEAPCGFGAGEYVVLSIRDTGCGMSEETRGRLFDPFFTTKRAGRGTGIGLSTVASIVEGCGGAIRVESELGRGSSFHIFLPVAEPREEAVSGEAAPSEVASGDGQTILLVEGEKVVRGLFERLFEGFGYEVLAVEDAAAAIETCARHEGPIHLLVTDLGMPRGLGRELAEQVSRARPGIRVLFTSSHREQVLVDEGVWDRSVPVVEKPFAVHELATRVRDALAAPAEAAPQAR